MGQSWTLPREKWLAAVRVLSRGGRDAPERALQLLLDVESTSADADRVSRAVERTLRQRTRAKARVAGRKLAATGAATFPGQAGRDELKKSFAAGGVTRNRGTAGSTPGDRSRSIDDWYAPHRW